MKFRLGTEDEPVPTRSGFPRAASLTFVAALGLMLALGVLFALTRGGQQMTSSAVDLHHADETLRAATVVRAQTGLALYMMTVDDAFGTNSAEAAALSLSEGREALEDLNQALSVLKESQWIGVDRAVGTSREYASTSAAALDAITDGDVDVARKISGEQQDLFETARSELEEVRGSLAQEVEGSEEILGSVGTVILFLVAFLVPAAVILIYRRLLFRQQRQAELESRLEMEKRLNNAREDFIANVSHELRTPLTGIIGLAQILSEDPTIASSESASELLHLVVAESHDLTRMVEDLLTTARLDAHALHFDFHDIGIEEVVADVVEPLARAGTMITWDCEHATVRVDGLRARQILRNLISNARKYGGSKIEVVGRVHGSSYRCDVADDGEGIPEDLADRMFERFIHRGGRTGVSDSVGLGLSIVNALAEGMGGSVGYKRVEHKTVFSVLLPLSDNGQRSKLEFSGDRAGA